MPPAACDTGGGILRAPRKGMCAHRERRLKAVGARAASVEVVADLYARHASGTSTAVIDDPNQSLDGISLRLHGIACDWRRRRLPQTTCNQSQAQTQAYTYDGADTDAQAQPQAQTQTCTVTSACRL